MPLSLFLFLLPLPLLLLHCPPRLPLENTGVDKHSHRHPPTYAVPQTTQECFPYKPVWGLTQFPLPFLLVRPGLWRFSSPSVFPSLCFLSQPFSPSPDLTWLWSRDAGDSALFWVERWGRREEKLEQLHSLGFCRKESLL